MNLTVSEAVQNDVITNAWVAYYLGRAKRWFEHVGIDPERLRFRQHLRGELAHYASDCWDAETKLDNDWIEIAGVAYRADYDLSKHDTHSEDRFTLFEAYDQPKIVERPTLDPDMRYLGPKFGDATADAVDALETLTERDPTAFEDGRMTIEVDSETHSIPVERTGFTLREETVHGEHVTPNVIEPAIGIDRVVYSVLVHTLRHDTVAGENRTRLALPTEIAPIVAGVFPLTDTQAEQASELATRLSRHGIPATYDASGSIGRRYRRLRVVATRLEE